MRPVLGIPCLLAGLNLHAQVSKDTARSASSLSGQDTIVSTLFIRGRDTIKATNRARFVLDSLAVVGQLTLTEQGACLSSYKKTKHSLVIRDFIVPSFPYRDSVTIYWSTDTSSTFTPICGGVCPSIHWHTQLGSAWDPWRASSTDIDSALRFSLTPFSLFGVSGTPEIYFYTQRPVADRIDFSSDCSISPEK